MSSHPLYQRHQERLYWPVHPWRFRRPRVPLDFETLGSHTLSDGSIAYSSIARGNKIGVQFHPEVFDDTPEGYQLFRNFLEDIAGLEAGRGISGSAAKDMIEAKQEADHRSKSVSGMSSRLSAAALIPAWLRRWPLTSSRPSGCTLFTSTAASCATRTTWLSRRLQTAGLPVKKIDAVEDFEQATVEIDGERIGPLIAVTDPEEKRKIIGKEFIDYPEPLGRRAEIERSLAACKAPTPPTALKAATVPATPTL